MKCAVLFFAVVLGVASAVPINWDDCPRICPQVIRPVCATDGIETRTFDNECQMKQMSCLRPTPFEVLNSGDCFQIFEKQSTDLDSSFSVFMPEERQCPKIWNPVCGSDGFETKTFPNECVMNVVNRLKKSKPYRKMRSGACSEEYFKAEFAAPVKSSVIGSSFPIFMPEERECPEVWNPVCGSDGSETKTFPNECIMNAANSMLKNKPFRKVRSGSCSGEYFNAAFAVPVQSSDLDSSFPIFMPKERECPEVWSPICGSDGSEIKTFPNECIMKAANSVLKNKPYRKVRSGACSDDYFKAAFAVPVQCAPCPLMFSPVCASNGFQKRTFSNECSVERYNCLNGAKNAKFSKTRPGEC